MQSPREPQPPLPLLTNENRHFWTGGADGKLLILRCAACGWYLHPPAPICPQCLSSELAPQAVSGSGTVATFTINHQPWQPGVKLPYVVAIVELGEQKALRLTTNIINCPVDAVHIGQRVRVVFEQHEDVWLPLFEPGDSA